MAPPSPADVRDEWLWGWDPTPGIVSVWADGSGRARVWRRDPATLTLIEEEDRFRPWLLLDRLDDLEHLGDRLGPEGTAGIRVGYRELEGPGALRFVVTADHLKTLTTAVLDGARRRLGRAPAGLRDIGDDAVLALAPEEQYLVRTGRTYFRGLGFDDLRRLQFDLETTGLDPRHT
ncbi:MAG: DNA polymerase II, partial [Gemmatimonadales bacterium]